MEKKINSKLKIILYLGLENLKSLQILKLVIKILKKSLKNSFQTQDIYQIHLLRNFSKNNQLPLMDPQSNILIWVR